MPRMAQFILALLLGVALPAWGAPGVVRVCSEVDTKDPIIPVQDHHFALAPNMIRGRLPESTVIAFWHIPWPDAERMGLCPWRNEVLAGMLGSSIVGFHTQLHCNNFMDSVDRYMETRIDREQNAVVMQGRGADYCNRQPVAARLAYRSTAGTRT
ncbi:MAG TPA: trehalose-6-phosphate synthase [Candidatus Sulfopaludibacter sp.]|nr:trehalose-6-phosphate synthase [Candidatus Sulfopaludibacter sp.]